MGGQSKGVAPPWSVGVGQWSPCMTGSGGNRVGPHDSRQPVAGEFVGSQSKCPPNCMGGRGPKPGPISVGERRNVRPLLRGTDHGGGAAPHTHTRRGEGSPMGQAPSERLVFSMQNKALLGGDPGVRGGGTHAAFCSPILQEDWGWGRGFCINVASYLTAISMHCFGGGGSIFPPPRGWGGKQTSLGKMQQGGAMGGREGSTPSAPPQ